MEAQANRLSDFEACLQEAQGIPCDLAAQRVHCRRHQRHKALQVSGNDFTMESHKPPGLIQGL